MNLGRKSSAVLVGAGLVGVLVGGGVAANAATSLTPAATSTAPSGVVAQDLATVKADRTGLRAARRAERQALHKLRADRAALRRDRRQQTSGSASTLGSTPTPSASPSA
jgi:hypothetical protein